MTWGTVDTDQLLADLRRLRDRETQTASATVPDSELENQTFDFGKFKHRTFKEVYAEHDHYVKWCVEHFRNGPSANQELWLRYISLKTKAKLDNTNTEPTQNTHTEPTQMTGTQEFVRLDAGSLQLHSRMDTLETNLQSLCERVATLERLVQNIAEMIRQPTR